jgi:hypothetical protein
MLANSDFNQAVEIFNQGFNVDTFKIVKPGIQETFLLPNTDLNNKLPYSFIITETNNLGDNIEYLAELGRVGFNGGKATTNESVTRTSIILNRDVKSVVLIDILNFKFYSLSEDAYKHLLFLKSIKDMHNKEMTKLIDTELAKQFQAVWDQQLKAE